METALSNERHLVLRSVKGDFDFQCSSQRFVNLFLELLGHLIIISALPSDREVISMNAHWSGVIKIVQLTADADSKQYRWEN